MAKQTEQNELAALISAIRPFAVRMSMANKHRIKVHLNTKHDAAQLNAVLSNHSAQIQRGNGGVLFIDYGERSAVEVAEIVARENRNEGS